MTYYVAVDIGCIECREESNVLGIFTDKDAAKAACTEHQTYQKAHWFGQHHFEVHTVGELNVAREIGGASTGEEKEY